MSEITENTFSAYLGPEFQIRLMWQILVEPEFAEKAIPDLSVEYFDDPNLKRLYIIIHEFIKLYDKVPNLQNQSIHQAINLFKTPNNVIEEETLFSVIKRIELWNERVLNKQIFHDGDVVQKATNNFIKQQEYRKLGEFILDKTKSGDIKHKFTLSLIDDKIQKIAHIGDEEDYGTDVTEGVEKALRKEFRQTIPTGVEVLDALTGGGLGRGEIGLILSPTGVGKSTLLTKIANTARELDYNVLQIIFEDTVEQIQRKHYTIWCGTALSQIDDNNDEILEKTNAKIQSLGNKGRLTIKRFSQEDTTMKDIRNWILRYQKKFGFKYDIIVLDYLDCLNSHIKTTDSNHADLIIVKSFEAMAGDFNIPCWSAIQSNRGGIDSELVEANQTGGSIKRVQKAHFFMSVAKTPDQKEAHLANIRIIKARFAQDGQTFKDCIFNNDTMQIVIRDDRYSSKKHYGMKKYGDAELERLEKKTSSIELHTRISDAAPNPLSSEDIYSETILMDMAQAYRAQSENKSSVIEIDSTEENFHPEAENQNSRIIKDGLIEFDITDATSIVVNSNGITNLEIPSESISYNHDIDEEKTVEKWDKLGLINGDEEIVDEKFVWTGETFTENIVENEVNLESIKYEINVDVLNDLNIDELEKLLLSPDEIDTSEKHVFDMLKKISKNQNVIKLE